MPTLTAPLQGTVVACVEPGTAVRAGQAVVVVESMTMEHAVAATEAGTVGAVHVVVGDTVVRGQRLAELAPAGEVAAQDEQAAPVERHALERLRVRRAAVRDDARPEQVQRRHDRGGRTARENVADLVDEGSWVEYGALAVAAQRGRRTMEELVARTPADGVLAGFATVDGAPVAVVSYDYTVLAGTQGMVGHRKQDRLFELVARQRTPVVLYAEGGGGRPGDTDHLVVSALDTRAFVLWAGLSGVVPRIAVVSGSCFAGNAALAGSSDLVVATASSSWGMGGPAMIEGGGLGVVAPQDVGPLAVQVAAGSVDVAVEDEAEATAVVRQLLGYFTGPVPGQAPDQALLRDVVPEDRRRAYDVRDVLTGLFDVGSVLELRPAFAPGMVTALARLDGRAVGVVANNPLHLAGAVTSHGADKAARFLQLCDAFALPVVSLVDTPGMMVGPEAEATGLVRHSSRLFVAGATLTVPVVAVVLRKAYGLGAQAMLAGGTHEPLLTLAWPTGELAPMGLEGAVRLGFRRELAAAEDPEAEVERLVAFALEHTSAVNAASVFEVDDV
ncbi:MAG: carboxyl transferase domain-containing protein, partial [Mycobacteriales bacterium]